MSVSCRDRRTFFIVLPLPKPMGLDPIDDFMFVVPSSTVKVDGGRWIETDQDLLYDDDDIVRVVLTARQPLTRRETLAALAGIRTVINRRDG